MSEKLTWFREHGLFTIGSVAICILAIVLVYQWQTSAASDDVLHVALVCSMNEGYAANCEMMRNATQLYLDQINLNEGGVNGKQVRMLSFDDEGDRVVARQRAEEIVQDGRALVVLGHYFSYTSIPAGEIYRDAKIPAITGASTAEALTTENDWYFRVIPNSEWEGVFLANYIHQVMGQETVSILYDSQDDYSIALARGFAYPFIGLGGTVKYHWDLDVQSDDVDAQIDGITNDLLSDDPGLIFIASQQNEAIKFIVSLKLKGLTYPIVGGDALGDTRFGIRFQDVRSEEEIIPGYFSDGIYASSPWLLDVASEEAQTFREEYKKKYHEEPNWIAAGAYDAAMMAVKAMQETSVQGDPDNRAAERIKIRDYLALLTDVEDAVKGVGGDIYFDEHGDLVRSVAIGQFKKQKFVSAPTQLKFVRDLDRISDLETALDEGQVFVVNGRHVYKTEIVYVGVDFVEVSNLSMKDSTYKLDFYLWFRYQGQVDADNIQFINAVEDIELGEPVITETLFIDAMGEIELDESATDDETLREMTYRAYHVTGEFKGDFDFRNYPFDRQRLEVKFRHADATRDTLIYVIDHVGMRDTTSAAILDHFDDTGVLESLADWEGKSAGIFQDIFSTDSTLGDPQLFDSNTATEYSRFNAFIEVERNALTFIRKSMVNLFIVFFLVYLSFFLPLGHGARLSFATSALFTTALFHLSLTNSLPQIGYTVAMEYFFYVGYVLSVVMVIFQLVDLRLNVIQKGKDKDEKQTIEDWRIRANRVGKIVYPSVALLSIMAIALLYDVISLPIRESIVMPTLDADVQLATNDVDTGEHVTLVLGSWRTQDVEKMNTILKVFNAQSPNITVKFEPTSDVNYVSTLLTQLESGTAPDLFYIAPFSGSRAWFEDGYLESLQGMSGLNSFTWKSRSPWRILDDGVEIQYGMPLLAVSHGIYYNKDIFAQLNLEPPTTWEELLVVAQTIQADDAYDYPFANVLGQRQTVYQVFLSLVPNFIGGRQGRHEYLLEDRCFDDAHTVKAFQALADIVPFMQPPRENLTYAGSKQLFLQGESLMWMGGSWDISSFESVETDFEWSIFAVPAPAGQTKYITFHPDVGIGLNRDSPHKEEAKQFLEWLAQVETAELFSNELPGFFPMHENVSTLDNVHANDFLALNWGRNTDVRWASELQDGLPSGYDLIATGVGNVGLGKWTPQKAADELQAGLGQWFEPAQRCKVTEKDAQTPLFAVPSTDSPTPTTEPSPAATPAPFPTHTPDASSTEPTGGSATAKTTIEVWDFQQSDKDILEAQQRAIVEFERENPNIKVNVTAIPFAEYYDTLLNAVQNGEPPDVSTLTQQWTAQWADSGAVIPLDEYIKDSAVKRGDFFPGSWNSNLWEDETWGIPLSNDVWQQLYYNKDIFAAAGLDPENPPATWDELLEAAAKLNNPPEQYGIVIMDAGDWIVYIVDSFIYSNGGRVINGEGTMATINSPEAVEALEYLRQLNAFAPPGTFNRSESDAVDLFTSGHVAMILAGSWQQDTFRNIPDLNWGVAMTPAPDGKTFHGTLGGWNLLIYAASEHQDAAWKYIEFLATHKDVQKTVNSLIPARLDAGEEFINELREGPQIIFDTVNNGYPSPLSTSYPDISRIHQDMILTIWNGGDAQAAADEAAAAINAILVGE
ncbi:MAG: extracellular solute-binding protein [Chloroflexi bacterium]|nr:extracellular solute-binding protein [Chloroflexota bacterium]